MLKICWAVPPGTAVQRFDDDFAAPIPRSSPAASGGCRDRALCMNPAMMLFDEPTSALDPEMVKEVSAP